MGREKVPLEKKKVTLLFFNIFFVGRRAEESIDIYY